MSRKVANRTVQEGEKFPSITQSAERKRNLQTRASPGQMKRKMEDNVRPSVRLQKDKSRSIQLTSASVPSFSGLSFRQASEEDQSEHQRYMSKRVYPPWYKRYNDVLTLEEMTIHQPMKEIFQDEIENAMIHVYGQRYRHYYADQLAHDQTKAEMRLAAMKIYSKAKRAAKNQDQEAKELPSSPQSILQSNVISHFKIPEKKKENEGCLASKWNRLKSDKAKDFFQQENDFIRKDVARKRFHKVVNVVMCINQFLAILFEKHYSIRITTFRGKDLTDGNKDSEGMESSNPTDAMYAIPLDIVLILTKPWYTRTIDEIGDVVKCFYPRWVYHKYPLNVQLQIAAVAWYTKIGRNRPIVREGNAASRFYYLISGQIAVTELIEDHRRGNQYMRFVKYINKGERFGDEEMDLPDNQLQRFYNAYSTTTCELLAIDFSDYQESLSYYEPSTEAAPLHILYLQKIRPFNEVPTSLLIRAAKTGKIRVFYFCHEAIVSTHLENSHYVFVVWQGSCHTAIKQPHQNGQGSGAHLTHGTRPVSSGKRDTAWDRKLRSACPLTQPTSPGMGVIKEAIASGKFMNSRLTQDFAQEVRRISEKCSKLSRSEAMKLIVRIPVMQLIASTYSVKVSYQISKYLVEKMYSYEALNLQSEEEKRLVMNKTLKINRKLIGIRKVYNSEVSLLKSIRDTVTVVKRHKLTQYGPPSEIKAPLLSLENQGENQTQDGVISRVSTAREGLLLPTFRSSKDVDEEIPLSEAMSMIVSETVKKAKNKFMSMLPDAKDNRSISVDSDHDDIGTVLYKYSSESRMKTRPGLTRGLLRKGGKRPTKSRSSLSLKVSASDTSQYSLRKSVSYPSISKPRNTLSSMSTRSSSHKKSSPKSKSSGPTHSTKKISTQSRGRSHSRTSASRIRRSKSKSLERSPSPSDGNSASISPGKRDLEPKGNSLSKNSSVLTKSKSVGFVHHRSPQSKAMRHKAGSSSTNSEPDQTSPRTKTKRKTNAKDNSVTIAATDPKMKASDDKAHANDTRPHSPDHYSDPIVRYTRLDIIGNEYVDYNDGSFRQPRINPALLSDGVELIFVAKSFLLERFYKHHRNVNKIDLTMGVDEDQGKDDED